MIPSIWWAIQIWGLGRESPNPSAFPTWWVGSSFPGLVPSDEMVDSESVMGINPGDFDVVIGYQVDEFTHTWSAEQFVAHSHIYPGFTGKVSSLTHFPLELGCEDCSFLDQAMADFEQGLDSILTYFLETPELDASLVSLMSFHLQILQGFFTSLVLFLIILNHSLLLASDLINCGARLGLFLHLYLWLPRCLHPNQFIIFLATLQLLDSGHRLHQATSP